MAKSKSSSGRIVQWFKDHLRGIFQKTEPPGVVEEPDKLAAQVEHLEETKLPQFPICLLGQAGVGKSRPSAPGGRSRGLRSRTPSQRCVRIDRALRTSPSTTSISDSWPKFAVKLMTMTSRRKWLSLLSCGRRSA